MENIVSVLQNLSRALDPRDIRLNELAASLPKLKEADVPLDAVCPICLVPFRAHLAEEELALAMDSPAHPPDDLGVTRLADTCGHYYCYKCISAWIRQPRNSCPTCRRPLLLTPPLPLEDAEGMPPAHNQQQQQDRPGERPWYEVLLDSDMGLPDLSAGPRVTLNRTRIRDAMERYIDVDGSNGDGAEGADNARSDGDSGRDRTAMQNGVFVWNDLVQMFISTTAQWEQRLQNGASSEGAGDREHGRVDHGDEEPYPDRSEFGMYS